MPRSTKAASDRRLEFINAAEALFNEKGFENTSVDDIVQRVGVAKGLFYYYFKSREELLAAIVDRILDEMEQIALVLIRAYPSDDGRVETVRSFFGVHKIVVTPNGQYHVLMHGTTIHGAEKMLNDDGTPVTGRPERPAVAAVAT